MKVVFRQRHNTRIVTSYTMAINYCAKHSQYIDDVNIDDLHKSIIPKFATNISTMMFFSYDID